jgi:hypothetical protein
MTTLSRETEAETAAEILETDIYALAEKWFIAGRPYSEKEKKMFSGFGFEIKNIDSFLKSLREIGDPAVNDFVLTAVMHCGGKNAKDLCEAIYNSRGYQERYLETLLWLLSRLNDLTAEDIETRVRAWFAVELCPLKKLISCVEKNELHPNLRQRVIAYAIPAQAWRMAEDIWGSVDYKHPLSSAMVRVMGEFGCS